MRTLTLATLLAATACVSAVPKVATRSTVSIPGAEVQLTGSWSKTCRGHSGSLKSGVDYVADCKYEPIRVEVQCSACEIVGPRVQEVEESYEVRLVTLQPGPLHVLVTLTRLDTGEQHVEDRTIDVLTPNVLTFLCFDKRPYACHTTTPDASRVTDADPRILSAADPRIVVVAGVHGVNQGVQSRLMRVNGKFVPAEASLVGFSLAEVFPAARVGDGIAPGLYPVEVALGDSVHHFKVLAR